MKRLVGSLAVVLVLAVAAVGFAACGNALVGKWTSTTETNVSSVTMTTVTTIEFKSNGKCVSTTSVNGGTGVTITADYKVSGNKVTMTVAGITGTSTFQIKNGKLTITNQDGSVTEYTKA
jgi:hypothetical protein